MTMAVVFTALALCNFYLSGVVRNNFRPDNLDFRMLDAGRVIKGALPPDALVISVEYGVNSPMLLYYAHRRGWSFDVPRINAFAIDQMRRLGAGYFATTEWAAIQATRPEVVALLRAHRQIDLPGAPPDVALFDLSAEP
jgi:hypothetical protein